MTTLSAIITPSNVLTATNTQTLTNKSISGSTNTLTNIPLATAVSGTLPVGNGGTGITTTPSNGQIPIGNGTNYTAATLTAGTGISITNASGSITITGSASGPTIGLVRALAVNCILP